MTDRDVRLVGDKLGRDVLERLVGVAKLETLEEILHWGLAQRPPCDIVDVIVQDEFTHDVIVCGPSPAFLSFDTT
jgi:hypothetical protein